MNWATRRIVSYDYVGNLESSYCDTSKKNNVGSVETNTYDTINKRNLIFSVACRQKFSEFTANVHAPYIHEAFIIRGNL